LGEVPAELSLTPESDAALAEQAAAIPSPVVVRLLELLGEALEAIRAGADARTRLELALVKASRPETDTSLRALLARIERLEQSGAGTVSAVAVQREVPIPAQPAREDLEASMSSETPQAPMPPPVAQPEPASSAEASVPSAETPAPPAAAGEPATVAGAMAADSRVAVQEPPPGNLAGSLEAMSSTWPAVVDVVRAENALLGALIAEARPVEVQGEELTLGFASTFLKKKAEDPANRMTVSEALRVVTGGRWKLLYELREDLGELALADAPGDGDSEERRLARFMEEFDAEDITPEAGSGGEETDLPTLTGNEKGP
jgi:DNA polymerase-3 subunit gamma/tau